MDKLSKSKLREAAMSIREHNQIHSRKEPMAVCITQHLEFAADLIEKIADGKISLTEHRHGRWEYDDVNDLDYCSECGTGMNGEFPFCPWCGAPMDGGADNG